MYFVLTSNSIDKITYFSLLYRWINQSIKSKPRWSINHLPNPRPTYWSDSEFNNDRTNRSINRKMNRFIASLLLVYLDVEQFRKSTRNLFEGLLLFNNQCSDQINKLWMNRWINGFNLNWIGQEIEQTKSLI